MKRVKKKKRIIATDNSLLYVKKKFTHCKDAIAAGAPLFPCQRFHAVLPQRSGQV